MTSDSPASKSSDGAPFVASAGSAAHISEMASFKRALADLTTRQSSIEQVNAELRAELQSTKAELQSTKAELQSTKAELQSTKAELAKARKREALLQEKLDEAQADRKYLAEELQRALGIRRQSEKGPALDGGGKGDDNPPAPPPGPLPRGNKGRYKCTGVRFRYCKKCRRKQDRKAGFNAKTMKRQDWLRRNGSDCGLISAAEDLMRSKLAEQRADSEKRTVSMEQRQETFAKVKGLSTATDKPSRWDFRVIVTHLTCIHETVTDPETGKSIRAGDLEFGPKGYKITWRALSLLCLMVTEYAIPMERIGRMLGVPYFSAANISRWLQMIAEHILPIYLYLFRQLSDCNYLRMDDTPVLVLKMRSLANDEDFCADADLDGDEFEDELDKIEAAAQESGKANLVAPIAREMGRVAQYANGKGGKKGINLTLVSGQTDRADARSTIFFFRTHFGQAGNLISRIIAERKSNEEATFFIQSDRSAQNNVEKTVAKNAKIIDVGCYSHARRPFAKMTKEDEELCYYILRAFLLISHCEDLAFYEEVSEERILKYRRKERWVWKIILDVCEHVVKGKQHRFAKNKTWKPKSILFTAAQYIITHYKSLTVYLDHPMLFAENNGIERGLRPEKMIEDTAKFRSAEEGRIALDVIRTFISTSRAAEVEFEAWLTAVLKVDKAKVEANPEHFIPQNFANFSKLIQ
jgi:hypothetical protein